MNGELFWQYSNKSSKIYLEMTEKLYFTHVHMTNYTINGFLRGLITLNIYKSVLPGNQ